MNGLQNNGLCDHNRPYPKGFINAPLVDLLNFYQFLSKKEYRSTDERYTTEFDVIKQNCLTPLRNDMFHLTAPLAAEIRSLN